MAKTPEKSPPARKTSSGSGLFDVPLPNELAAPLGERTTFEHASTSPKAPISKKPSLKKKNSWNPDFDGVLHMGYIWYFEQNAEKKTPEELLYRAKEEKLSRILTLDRETTKNGWKKYFAAIWSDGRFAWYKPAKFSLYNKKLTGELEEVLFVPWRVCAFGEDVVRKLCPKHLKPLSHSIRPDDVEAQLEGMAISPPQTPKLPILSSSPPAHSLLTSFLETAGKGLCICTSPSVISLIVPQSPSSATSSFEELVCVVPKTSSQSLLMAVGGHDWLRGDVYCFACDSQDDLDIWKDCFALLTHRKIVQQSAFDHLLNTPVMITLPAGIAF
ncbi:hypothetical protein RvY_13064 [Ramazzottius varieornatus]|uniref:PH domain-containing protein n=1 Tax=Ramazzottius varieornatus TaxID=947166 RepID=A0A1D1VLN6_RAMVA|nr:hypothetical protein RvY_13064 [Ramazzottius varieornatus]